MPRYRYKCSECDDIIIVFHRIGDSYNDCDKCEQKLTMKKLLSTPFIIKKEKETNLDRAVGEITNEYIEMNREILKDQKKEAKEKDYEPT